MGPPGGERVDAAVREFLAEPATAGFVLDFDGTLSAIAPTPGEARALPGVGALLEALARHYRLVALLSGRRAADVHALLPVPGVRYLGLYGAEELGADTPLGPPPDWVKPLAAEASAFVTAGGFTGCVVEDKGRSLALHYRGATTPEAGSYLGTWAQIQADRLGLEVRPGRMVVELAEPGPTKEGTVEALIHSIGLRRLVVAGDDVADVASLRKAGELLGDRALRIGVGSAEAPPALVAVSDVIVAGPEGVLAVLSRFVSG
jgi:trehalose 6-phosphate phosphatase